MQGLQRPSSLEEGGRGQAAPQRRRERPLLQLLFWQISSIFHWILISSVSFFNFHVCSFCSCRAPAEGSVLHLVSLFWWRQHRQFVVLMAHSCFCCCLAAAHVLDHLQHGIPTGWQVWVIGSCCCSRAACCAWSSMVFAAPGLKWSTTLPHLANTFSNPLSERLSMMHFMHVAWTNGRCLATVRANISSCQVSVMWCSVTPRQLLLTEVQCTPVEAAEDGFGWCSSSLLLSLWVEESCDFQNLCKAGVLLNWTGCPVLGCPCISASYVDYLNARKCVCVSVFCLHPLYPNCFTTFCLSFSPIDSFHIHGLCWNWLEILAEIFYYLSLQELVLCSII